MSQQDTKPSLGDVLRHPMATMVVGFVLTGVIGTGVTQYFTAKHHEHQRVQKLAEERKEVVTKLSSLNAEHLASAEQLLSALERGKSTDQLAEMRNLYETATRRWRTESHPALMIAREVLPEDAYYRFRDRLRNEVQRRFMEPFGDCLSRASLAQDRGKPVADVLADCRARDLLEQAGRCGETLMDMFYDLAASTVENCDEVWLGEKRELHVNRVEDACALPAQKAKRRDNGRPNAVNGWRPVRLSPHKCCRSSDLATSVHEDLARMLIESDRDPLLGQLLKGFGRRIVDAVVNATP